MSGASVPQTTAVISHQPMLRNDRARAGPQRIANRFQGDRKQRQLARVGRFDGHQFQRLGAGNLQPLADAIATHGLEFPDAGAVGLAEAGRGIITGETRQNDTIGRGMERLPASGTTEQEPGTCVLMGCLPGSWKLAGR